MKTREVLGEGTEGKKGKRMWEKKREVGKEIVSRKLRNVKNKSRVLHEAIASSKGIAGLYNVLIY